MGLAGSLFPSGPSLTGECGDEDDLLCWGWGREGTAPTEKLLDEHVDRIQSLLRSGQGIIPRSVLAKLQDRAAEEGRTLSDLVRSILTKAVDEI